MSEAALVKRKREERGKRVGTRARARGALRDARGRFRVFFCGESCFVPGLRGKVVVRDQRGHSLQIKVQRDPVGGPNIGCPAQSCRDTKSSTRFG